MAIKILVFGPLSDIVHQNEIELKQIKDTDDLKQQLNKQFPKLVTANYALAVNKQQVTQNTVLNDGDTVALLPAFSGG